MSELGRLLSDGRANRGVSLADVEAVTRIREKYLEALEVGDYDALPRGAVARGFVRTYARYLNLDIDEAQRLYMQETNDSSADVPIAEVGKPRLVDYRPLEVALMDGRPRREWWYWAMAAVIIVALGGGGWWLLGRGNSDGLLAAFGPAPTDSPSSTPTRWVVTATPPPPASPTPIRPTPTSDLLPLPTPTLPPTLTSTPSPTATPELVASLAMEMRLTQRAWLRVMVDGVVVEENTLETGETRYWEAADSITIRTGNGAGVTLLLNGEELGPMGKVGEVVERTWTVVQGEVLEAPAGEGQDVATPTPTAAG